MNNCQRFLVALIMPLYPVLLAAQTPQVISTTPAQNELDVSFSTDISVSFDIAMDRLSFVPGSFLVNGMSSGASTGIFTFNGPSTMVTFNPTGDFLYGELVTVVLTTDIESSTGTPIEGYVFNFTVETDPSAAAFDPITYYPLGSTYGGTVFAADYNNDGFVDIATTSGGDGLYPGDDIVSVLLNDGAGNFNSDTDYPTGRSPTWLQAVDLELDGDLDLVVGKYGINILQFMVFYNAGDGTFPSSHIYYPGVSQNDGFAADFNDDGYPDIATVNDGANSMMVMLNDQAGNFISPTFYPTAAYAGNIAGADFDNDGDIDLVSRQSLSVTVFLNDGNADFSDSSSYNVSSNYGPTETADMNGDGYIDLVTGAAYGNSYNVLLNDGNGGFPAETTYNAGGTNVHLGTICLADYDGDGDIDVAAGYAGNPTSSVVIYLNDGNGVIGPPDSYFGNGGGANIFAADINNDGRIDLAVRDDNVSDPDKLFFYWNEGPPPCAYVIGDVNGSASYNGLDITYGVNYLKGIGPPPTYQCDCGEYGFWYETGDVNATCTYNGLDITYGVNYLKGIGPLPAPCPDCPPN